MSHVGREPLPSLTSSPVTVDNALPPGSQMTQSQSEAIERLGESSPSVVGPFLRGVS